MRNKRLRGRPIDNQIRLPPLVFLAFLAMQLSSAAIPADKILRCNDHPTTGRLFMKDLKEAVGHILVMQLLVTAVIVDQWAAKE